MIRQDRGFRNSDFRNSDWGNAFSVRNPKSEFRNAPDLSGIQPKNPDMESLRFVHAADLHLDSPFRGIGQARPALKNRLQAATLGALERVVDHTINAKADFLVIAGDIYDSKDRSLRALVAFRK